MRAGIARPVMLVVSLALVTARSPRMCPPLRPAIPERTIPSLRVHLSKDVKRSGRRDFIKSDDAHSSMGGLR
jgi:hypothetical protein